MDTIRHAVGALRFLQILQILRDYADEFRLTLYETLTLLKKERYDRLNSGI